MMNDAFDYIAVLVSIVLGLCATLVMSQLSEAIQAHHRKHGYWVHTVWMVNLFIYLILEWWVFYRWHNTTAWNFFSSHLGNNYADAALSRCRCPLSRRFGIH